MLLLKQRLYESGYTASDLAFHCSFNQPVVSNALNHARIPVRRRMQFIDEVENFLKKHDIESEGAWSETQSDQAISKPNPEAEPYLETEMLTQASLKHFKLFRNPFLNDVREAKDVYLGDDSRYLLAAMRDAARNQGILALVGDSGAGKSILRKQLLEDLLLDGDVSVIQPRIIDKSVATCAGLCDAIIDDLSDAKPKRSMEAKARQVEDLLLSAAKGGQRHVLIIEEAHDLTIPVLKFLKRFWELEDGFSKLLGIILIGQTELAAKLNERKNYQLREFTRRCMIEQVPTLEHDLEDYLSHKFTRAGGQLTNVFNSDCYEVIHQKLGRKSNGFSMLYPQIINNLSSRAMNLAQQIGEPLVTPDIIREC